MTSTDIDISPWHLALSYALLVIPLAVILWTRAPLLRSSVVAVLRMTVQLLLVGFYLQVVFALDSFWLTGLWLLIMVVVADVSIVQGCGLHLRRFIVPLFIGLAIGTVVPLFYFVGVVLQKPNLLEAQFAIPIGGMILGNCLRANIVGIKGFYESIRTREKAFLHALAQGARLAEAVRPYLRDAVEAALAPTVATMATIGLVALPGMMTGVILAGAPPMAAIKYQIVIMLAIFSGTALTVVIAIGLTMRSSFNAFGVLDRSIFRSAKSA